VIDPLLVAWTAPIANAPATIRLRPTPTKPPTVLITASPQTP
jgi:hypothetical protein